MHLRVVGKVGFQGNHRAAFRILRLPVLVVAFHLLVGFPPVCLLAAP
jgi:hypothetical protein